jgi:hypothetical protein
MLPQEYVGGWVRQSMKRFRYGWGTFKMDWALSGPVPWNSGEARQAAVSEFREGTSLPRAPASSPAPDSAAPQEPK